MTWVDTWTDPLYLSAYKEGKRSLRGLIHQMRNGELIIPFYQRDRIWTTEQQANWMGHLLSGAPCPTIYIREVDTPDGFRDELLDGQQRLTACLDWLAGDIPAHIPWSEQNLWCPKDAPDKALFRLAIPCVTMPVTTTDEDAMNMYLRINTAGTPHTQEELDRVRHLLQSKEQE